MNKVVEIVEVDKDKVERMKQLINSLDTMMYLVLGEVISSDTNNTEEDILEHLEFLKIFKESLKDDSLNIQDKDKVQNIVDISIDVLLSDLARLQYCKILQ